jgi:hypothetical protein
MRYHKVRPVVSLLMLALGIVSGAFFGGCRRGDTNNQTQRQAEAAQPTPANIPVSDGFDYPVGRAARVTEANDGDGWYNAQDLGENNHLGEDWNGEKGGNSDCGAPVYAASKGLIVFAAEAGPGWAKSSSSVIACPTARSSKPCTRTCKRSPEPVVRSTGARRSRASEMLTVLTPATSILN